jgi:hypothetical protein
VELIVCAQTQAAADRVLIGPELVRGGLAEDDGGLRLARLRMKAVAGEQSNAEGCEIVRLHEGVIEDGSRAVRRGLFSVERYGGGSNAAALGRPSAGDCHDFRQAGEAIAQLADEGVAAVRVVFRTFGKLEVEIDDVFGVVSGVHPECLDGAPDQHASSDQEHEGDGNLGGNEDAAQPAAPYGRRRYARIYGRGERGAGAFERGGEAEENASNEGDGEDVGKDLGVGSDMQDQGSHIGREWLQPRSSRTP